MNGSVTWKEGLSFTGTADSGFEIALGASREVGGRDDGFRPLELMIISLAGCTAMDVISILTKKRQDVSDFSVSVQGEREEEHPKVFTSLHILYKISGTDIDETAVRRAIELSSVRYCPAQAMLGKIVQIDMKYKIEDGDGNIREGGIDPLIL